MLTPCNLHMSRALTCLLLAAKGMQQLWQAEDDSAPKQAHLKAFQF